MRSSKVLLVDLNNFARYPTLAIGYLVASLRRAGIDVEVLSPLAHGVPAVERERRENFRDQVQRRLFFSSHPAMLRIHDAGLAAWGPWTMRPNPTVLQLVSEGLKRRPDTLLLSAYLDHYPSVRELGELAAAEKVPLLLGGPIFNLPEVARAWLDIPGLAAIFGGEADLSLPAIVTDLVAGRDLRRHPGVYQPGAARGSAPPPLRRLETLPVPDFTDFPWPRYRHRVVPVMTGRGCEWGRCIFCSDVVTANGRTYRSRPLDGVLDELQQQSLRYATRDFIFLDIKLNSELPMWRGLLERFQHSVPSGRWVGTVHVGAREDNGLTADDLTAARAAGMARISFGLESGSQRLNDTMAKGTHVARTSQFLRHAHAAGLSVRTTMMIGYPGETPSDLDASVAFLHAHAPFLDRVRLSRFKAIPGTRFHDMYGRDPNRFPSISRLDWNYRYARASYQQPSTGDRSYRRSKAKLLRLVHSINRQPLRHDANVFDGLM